MSNHLSPWSIALISTDHDLSDVRNVVADHLSKYGFEILAFERPSYPVQPNIHSHEACIKALSLSDIVVLFIDKRYGGLFLGSGLTSITETEYNHAVKENKIIIPCIRKKAWEERHSLFELIKQFPDKEARNQVKPAYVEDWKVLDFIEKVRKADTNNFVIFFDTIDDLTSTLCGRLTGLTRFIVEEIMRAEVATVLSTKTTTGMAFSLGDVFGKDLQSGYFTEPPIVIKSSSGLPDENASALMLKLQKDKLGIVLLGGPGSGKSTLIAKAFIAHSQIFDKNQSNRIPLFVSLRGRGSEYSFSFDSFINDSCKESLSKHPYPLLSLQSIIPVFYIDGFDELSENVAAINLQKLIKSDFINFPFVLSCRTRFASDYLEDIELGSRFTYIIELEPWGVPAINIYVDKFCQNRGKAELAENLKNALQGDKLKEIASNPLLLTLFLWIVEEEGMHLPLDVTSQTVLFDKFLNCWVKRDLARARESGNSSVRQSASAIRSAWELTAWEIYRARFDVNKSLTLNQLIAKLGKLLPDVTDICEREAYTGLLDIRKFSKYVMGMIHEQFLEHLVAHSIADGMKNGKYPFPDSLGFVIRPEINRIIRSIWQSYDDTELLISLDNLWNVYLSASKIVDADDSVRINQVFYYIGRINNQESLDRLVMAYKREQNLSVSLSIGFGLIKRGYLDVEEELFNKLKRESLWDKGNRGYHLVYYRDWQVDNRTLPYLDPDNIPWRNTLIALLKHIEGGELRHLRLRRIELFTIKRLIETRGRRGPLTTEVMQKLEHAVFRAVANIEYEKLSPLVQAEFVLLKDSWINLPEESGEMKDSI